MQITPMYKRPLDTRWPALLLRTTLYAVVIAALCAPMYVCAQASGNAPGTPTLLLVKKASDTVTVSWPAPTQYSDNTALGSVPLTYTVYSAAPGAPWKPAASALTVLSWTSPPLPKGPQCYTVTASTSGLESAAAAAACIGVGVPPNPPGAIGVK
jgi:hypothetical protein